MQKVRSQSIRKKNRGFQNGEKIPPIWKSEIVTTRRMRFKATAAVLEVSLGIREIAMSVAGVVAVTTTTSGILCKAIRLRKVETWFNAATAGTPVEAMIDWNSTAAAGTTYGPGSSISQFSTSTAEYSHIKSSPPEGSYASLWHAADDQTSGVTVTIPAGGICDITCDFVYNDSNAIVSGASLSGATVGLWYHKQPDTNLVVMGNVNTIA